MAKVRNDSKLRQFAVIGARMRVQELQAEIDRIKKQFGSRVLGASAGSATTQPRRPRRRPLSAAARKRISEAQKARWAKQKATRSG